MWKITINGPQVPTKDGAGGVVSPKVKAEWNEDDKRKRKLNANGVNMLNCAISFEEYLKVSRCKTAKKIWNNLQATREGTTQVRETRIDMLSKEYKMFSMKEGESIDDMFEIFFIISNRLEVMRITHSE
ncbi:uncharacterized protein LOC107469083 [Arachis duranensis]|uniref:Uncharacterized protein LOC107469083 n=1 Tax=Arachis duranensis TaxID=130453 RepID=A0A6P4C599_ARADU|nr:uncharacterized protein LOC107469083 [Arachis duranensis]